LVGENIAPFLAPPFTARPRISFEIKVVHVRVFLEQPLAKTVKCDALKKSVVAYETENTAILVDAVRTPPVKPHVGIVQFGLQRGGGILYISLFDPCVDHFVFSVLVVVVFVDLS
jgi:hypothetical protein